MDVKQEDFRFYRRSENMQNEGKAGQFYILLMLKNVENEGKVGGFQILLIFKKIWKMKIKQEDLIFYQC